MHPDDHPNSGPVAPPAAAPAPEPGVAPVYHVWNQAPPPRRRFPIMGLLFVLFVVLPGLLVALLIVAALSQLTGDSSLHEHFVSGEKYAAKKIAIITVDGAIINGEGYVKQQIDAVRDDDAVEAIVLRVDSPGGSVTASDYIYHHLCKLKEEKGIPLVVSMGGMAASGGYYIAMAVGNEENSIFAEPTTWTGSIGLIIPHYNVGGLLKHWEIEEDSIASGPLKETGTITRPMKAEEKKVLEELVASSFVRFQSIVKSGRPKLAADPDALAKLTTGQVFTTEQAIGSGLVDKEGFVEEAVARAAQLAKLSKSEFQVVRFKKPAGFPGLPFAEEARVPDISAIVDLASPRAYYLFTLMPVVTAEK
jgi:protease-4